MSNDVENWIIVDDGKLTAEEINRAVYGRDSVDEYYQAHVQKSGCISLRTKWRPPLAEIASLAYEKSVSVTMEFDSVDNSEIGSMQFYYRRQRIEDLGGNIGVLQYYRPGAEPRWALEVAAKSAHMSTVAEKAKTVETNGELPFMESESPVRDPST